jgi:hypothetical protein
MVQDLTQLDDDERLYIEMEGEKANHEASLQLELDALYDSALHQLHDDVIYHEDAMTADTIA